MANYNSDYTGAQIDSAVSRANSTDVTAGTVAASKAVVVDSNKDITGFRHITATGTVTAANVSLTGNVDLGDASGDTVTITGSIDSNLIPATDDTYDIGSSSYAWQDIYLEGDIYLSDATEIDVASGNLTIDVAGDIEINADGGDITFKDASSTLAAIDSSGDFNVAGSIETATIDYTDGDLAITIADGGGVTFAQTSSQVSGSTIGNVTIANGSITDSSGAISFGNENLTTTGSSTAGSFVTGTLTVDDGSITDSDGSISFGDENLTTTGIISFGTLTDSGESIAVTKFVDEGDGISSNDNDTTIPTSAAVKDYVDTKVTAEDLDLTTDSGTIAIDLDSETLTLTGGTGVDTSASSNTVTFALDLNELATETTIADADFIAMVDATDDGSGKITFENLEDAIFASVSGDITITEGGVAAIQANSVALGTDTTGNYVATVADSGGGGITVANSGSESAAVTLELDIKGLTEDSIASGDFIAFSDEGESGDPANRETIDDVATLFAGTGLTASSAVIGVDASQTQITSVGTLGAGAISSGFGAIDIGSSTANFGATTVDSLSASDGNITNVGDIALDSISADGTDINIAVSDNSATALTVKQGSDAYLIIDTANSSESVAIGTGISGTAVSIGHGTSETIVNDNLTVTGDLTVSGTTTTVSSGTLTIGDTLIKLGQAYTGSAYDQGIVFTRGDGSSTNTQNMAFIWDESADTFAAIKAATEAGTTSGNVTITDHVPLRVGALTADDASTFTSTISAATGSTIGNLTLANGSITDSSGAIDFGNENLSTSGTLGAGVVTATGFTIGSAVIAEAELEMIDGITAGTAAASKAVVLDGSKNIATLGTIGSGAITATGSSSFATSIKTPLIEYTDGDDAITIADGGGITAANGITSTAASNSFGATAFSGAVTTNSTIDGIDIATRDGVLTSTTTTANAALPKAGGTMTGNIVMGDDTSIGIADDAERIEFDGAGDISVLGANFGIGIDSPAELLHLKKTATDSNVILKYGNDQRDWLLGVHGDDSDKFKLETHDKTDVIVIDSSGKVGIGTASPDFLLDCEKAGSQNIRVHSTDDNAGVIIASDTDEGQISFLAFASGADYRGEIKYDHDTTAASQKMQFKVGDNAVTAMTILGDGNVGIGTASPGSLLTVQGDNKSIDIRSANYSNVLIGSAGSSGSGLDRGSVILRENGSNKILLGGDGTATFEGNVNCNANFTSHGVSRLGGSAESSFTVLNGTAASGAFRFSTGTTNENLHIEYYEGDVGGIAFSEVIDTGGSQVWNKYSAAGTKIQSLNQAGLQNLIGAVDGNVRLLKLTNTSEGASDACGILWTLPRSDAAQFESGEIYVAKENGTWTGTPGTIDSQMVFKVVLSESLGTAMTIGSDKEIDGNFNDTSDGSLKENIEELSTTLDKVNLLKPSSFNWKESAERNNKNQIGFIAQEVEEQFEELVSAKTVDDREIKSINTIGLVSVLTKAVQELSAKVEALENA